MKVTSDQLRVDLPSGKAELEFLRLLKVGDVRQEVFIPGFPKEVMEWICTKAEEKCWELEGRFCGVKLLTAEINVVAHSLLLTIKEEVQ